VHVVTNVSPPKLNKLLNMKHLLQEEGIREHISLTEDIDEDILLETLVCFVLIEASTRAHSFCSRYDFGPWPLFTRFSPKQIHSNVSDAFMRTRAVLTNGCVFDELSPEVVTALATSSHASGASIFFDPGALPCPAVHATSKRFVLFPPLVCPLEVTPSGSPQPDKHC
jgi:hypothetical protein